MRLLHLLLILVLLVPSSVSADPASTAPPPQEAPANPVELPEAGFDPAADPEVDLAAALEEASQTGQRILVKVGGNWCVWCRRMELFFHQDPEIETLAEENFLILRVNVSKENKNKAFLARFPEVKGYPHLFVLENDGTVLHSQDTGSLESGTGYDLEKFQAFLRQWAPTPE